MSGRNIFYERNIAKSAGVAATAVFISHRRADAVVAREVAAQLSAWEIDFYLDEADAGLQNALINQDDKAVVEAIDRGLTYCSHLLGVLSGETAGSWWVPYEIGGARGRGRRVAHLLLPSVTELPEYVTSGRVLMDLVDFRNWASMVTGLPTLEESLRKSASIGLSKHIPAYRGMPRVVRGI